MSRLKHSIVCYNSITEVYNIVNSFVGVKEYAYILHYPETEEKKEHIHVYLEFDTPRNPSDIIKKFNSNIHCIEPVHDKKKLLRYFLHLDNPDKIQYTIDDLYTNIPNKLLDFIINPKILITDDDFLEMCLNHLDNNLGLRSLIKECIRNKQSNYLRKYWNILQYYSRIEEYYELYF